VACCGDSIQGLFNIVGNESYLILDGFEIQNYSSNNVNNEPAGIYVTGSGAYIEILNNIVHGITETAGKNGNAHGIGFYGTSTTPLSNITLRGNTVYGMVTGNSETIIFDGNVTGFLVTGNLVHDNNNIGIDATGFYGTAPSGHDQARNGVISANTVFNITSVKNPAYNGYGADGIYCDGCTGILIDRNLVYDCDLNIEAASENHGRVTSYVTINNNIVYGGNLAGISIGGYDSTVGGSDRITVVNNTLFNNNKTDGGGEFQIQYHATANIFENNIVYAGTQGVVLNGGYDSTKAPVTADYNLYYTAGTAKWTYQGTDYYSLASYQTASGLDKHSHFEKPGLISVTSPFNFDLTAASPARGTGNYALGTADYGPLDFAGNPRIVGTTVSIGAYEK
jgi:Right handed beta helix region